jgi:chromosome partitioning protein
MKTLAILSRKGGAGKTTIAAHLGVIAEAHGLRTLFVDTDPQRSLTDWWRSRAAATPILIEAEAGDLGKVATVAKGEGTVDLMVIDTMPAAEGDAMMAAKAADFALVVVRPSILDLRAAAGTVAALRQTKTPGAFLINGAPAKRGTYEPPIVLEAIEALGAYGLPVLPVVMRTRATFATALIDGRGANELEPKGQAAAEVAALWKDVKERLWPVVAK